MRVLVDFRSETIAVADVDEDRSARGSEIVVRARHKLGQLLITDALVEGVRATVIVDPGAQATLGDRPSPRLNSSHQSATPMPSSAPTNPPQPPHTPHNHPPPPPP